MSETTVPTHRSVRPDGLRNAVGLTLSGLVVVFLLFDAAIKLVPLDIVLAAYVELGWPARPGLARGMGLLLLACTLLYVWPRTALLGAVLLTGYLGGAIATHLRIDSPWPSHTLFGLYLGLMVWGGLYLRSGALRRLFPLVSADADGSERRS